MQEACVSGCIKNKRMGRVARNRQRKAVWHGSRDRDDIPRPQVAQTAEFSAARSAARLPPTRPPRFGSPPDSVEPEAYEPAGEEQATR